MARQERNDVDYFPHSVTHGKKMFYLRSKFGNDGYAVWFMLLENLGKASYHYLNLSDDVELMYLSSELKVSDAALTEIINDLVKLDEFDRELWEENKILFNEKFIENVSDAYKKRNNNCIDRNSLLLLLESKGIRKPSKGNPKPSKFTLKVGSKPQRIVKESKEEEIKEKEIKKEQFKDREYKPNFDKLFVKIKGRPNQDWITEVYEERRQDNETCGDNVSLFIEKTLKPSLSEFCSSCRKNGLNFFNETACLNYYKKASKGYIDDVDTWRKKLKALKNRMDNKITDKY